MTYSATLVVMERRQHAPLLCTPSQRGSSNRRSSPRFLGLVAWYCAALMNAKQSVSLNFADSVHDPTVSDCCSLGVCNVRRGPRDMGGKLCYNASSIIGRDNKRSAKSTFHFLSGFN